MNQVLPIVIFALVMGAFYVLIGRKRAPGEGAAFVLLVVAAVPLASGGLVLLAEYDRWIQPRVVSGVIAEKLSSTGENGTRTIGGRRWRTGGRLPTVFTNKGFRIDEELTRLMLTGSSAAWVVEYRYPCSGARGRCWQREFVNHAIWSELRVGQSAPVLTSSTNDSRGRLESNPPLSTALAKLAIGSTLVAIAAFVSGRWPRRRERYVTVPAVVTSVEPIANTGTVWRVGFAYFSTDGAARESADEVYVAGVKPGDSCNVVYPEHRPELGILRRREH